MFPRPIAQTLTVSMAFEEYHGRIHRYVQSMIHDSAEADDLTQETFLRAYRQRDSLRDANAVAAWLYKIATNVCLDRLRQSARRASLESDLDLDAVGASDPDELSLQQSLEQGEMTTCVQQYLADLPDAYRAVILLRAMHDLTALEIAETLGVSLATVKVRLHRARRRLRASMKTGCAFSHDERNVLVCEHML